ncbi:hypothetical protein [Butyrivibrio sp. INlla16]|uniref:hypothetical protein n=1 Tax=Butyrivibrio sp. INlla16 TaxID=1520807 RepID=UPI00088498B6|nr:hypothetical protein [Butyrivibrio sp. INlla16]SDB10679.1 methyl-accepting chemotaxis protein [Butyrivibrio sp. INlla16]
MGGMAAGYFVVIFGSVHVPYLWAFGVGLVLLVLLYNDVLLTTIISVFVSVVNFLYIFLFRMFSVEVSERINMVMTDAVFTILMSLMAVFYVRINSKQNKETVDEMQDAAKKQQEKGLQWLPMK